MATIRRQSVPTLAPAENQSIRLVRLPVLPATIRQIRLGNLPVSVNHIPYRNYFLSRLPHPFGLGFVGKFIGTVLFLALAAQLG